MARMWDEIPECKRREWDAEMKRYTPARRPSQARAVPYGRSAALGLALFWAAFLVGALAGWYLHKWWM
jgi:hypothetical protein